MHHAQRFSLANDNLYITTEFFHICYIFKLLYFYKNRQTSLSGKSLPVFFFICPLFHKFHNPERKRKLQDAVGIRQVIACLIFNLLNPVYQRIPM